MGWGPKSNFLAGVIHLNSWLRSAWHLGLIIVCCVNFSCDDNGDENYDIEAGT